MKVQTYKEVPTARVMAKNECAVTASIAKDAHVNEAQC